MEFCGFKINSIKYPHEAEGWTEGVYIKRKPDILSAEETGDAVIENGSVTVNSLHWREKEESGWGVYDYVEAPEFTFRSGLCNYTVRASFKNDGNDEIFVSAFCNGILKLVRSPIAPGTSGEVSFDIASVCDVTHIVFFVMDENICEKDSAKPQKLTLTSLCAEKKEETESNDKLTLFLASDSTVQTYDPYYYPQTGWGEVLYKYFNSPDFVKEYRPEGSSYSHCRAYELPDIIIENRAIGGRSSLSFYLEGKFDELLLKAKKGDFVFLQFGHNDATKARPNRYISPDDYKELLTVYVRAISERGITPVLVTPVMRRNYNEETDSFTLSFPEYREKMIQVASKTNTLLLDLGLISHDICTEVGGEGTKDLFLWTEAGKYSGAYINGSTDSTHLQRRGALVFAGALAELIKRSDDVRLSPVGEKLNKEKTYREYLK